MNACTSISLFYLVPERKLPSHWEGLGEGIMDFSFKHYLCGSSGSID
jgi:hypothetical protein